MKEDTKRVLEVCFFIIATMMLIKPPTEIIAYLSTNLSASTMIVLVHPAFIVFIIGCTAMVFVSVLRLIKNGKFFANLIAGTVYFYTIVQWIEVI